VKQRILALLLAAAAATTVLGAPVANAAPAFDHDEPITAVAEGASKYVELGQVPFRQPHRAYSEFATRVGFERGHYYAKLKRFTGTYKNTEDGDDLKCPNGQPVNKVRKVTFKARVEHPNGHPYRQEVQPDPIIVYCEPGQNEVSETHALEGIVRWDPDTSTGVPSIVFSWHWDIVGDHDQHDSYRVSMI